MNASLTLKRVVCKNHPSVQCSSADSFIQADNVDLMLACLMQNKAPLYLITGNTEVPLSSCYCELLQRGAKVGEPI